MKVCPVCGAKAFDDAAVCYGCLHRFGSGDLAPMGRHGALPTGMRQAAGAPDEPPPECYGDLFAASAAASVVPTACASAPGAFGPPLPPVSAQARWKRAPDGRWFLQVDVALAAAAL